MRRRRLNYRATDWRMLIVLIALASTFAVLRPAAAEDRLPGVTILVAASTIDVIKEIAGPFEKETGINVTISPGASNELARQIINGAPADLFLSASVEWAEKVKAEKLAADVQPLLANRLVLIAPSENPAKISDPNDLLAAGVKHVALAGENVPAGKYGQQALTAHKVYDKLVDAKKIVRGQDVRATLVYVERGEVEAGVVYATDASASTKVKTVFTFDPQTHAKIAYPLVLLERGKSNPSAVKFHKYLLSDTAAEVYQKHGFTFIK